MNSALYVGKVVHQRHTAPNHRLEYRVFSLLIDLDECESLDRSLRLFSYNRFGLFSLLDRDHGLGDGSDLRAYVRGRLADAGIEDAGASIRLLCYPRVLGYVFNPLSVFYCYGKDGSLRAVIYEVGNTFGERHSYIIPVEPSGRMMRHACDKVFYVSPFLPMDCRYRFHINAPDEQLRLFIHETRDGEPVLDAWFNGERRALDERGLIRVAFSIPLLTLKVIAGIHWEAFWLWRKGARFHKHPPTPKHGVTIINHRA